MSNVVWAVLITWVCAYPDVRRVKLRWWELAIQKWIFPAMFIAQAIVLVVSDWLHG